MEERTMKTFEIVQKDCMDIIETIKTDKELREVIGKAKEMVIDIYGNVEFMEAADIAENLQELTSPDTDVIFKVVSENTDGNEIKVVLTVSE